MRIVEELISFYRHIYLNLPGFTRLVGVAGAGAALRFGVFPANLYKLGEPTSGLEPLTCSLRVITHALSGSYRALSWRSLVSVSPGKASCRRSGRWSVSKLKYTAGCIDTGLPVGRRYFGQSDKPFVETAIVHHARWVMFIETRCHRRSVLPKSRSMRPRVMMIRCSRRGRA